MAAPDPLYEAARAIPKADLRAERITDPALIEPLISPPASRRLSPLAALLTLISCACVVTGAWFAGKLTWQMTQDQQPASLTTYQTIAKPAAARMPAIDINRIIAANLFGEAQAPDDDSPPPETRLAIVLQGIIFTDVKADARAIIARQGHGQNSYRIGQTIDNDTVLTEIHQGYVIIERSGERETLSLRAERNVSASSLSRQPVHRRHDLRGDYQIARVLGRVQARLMTDPGSVMSIMRIVPVTGPSGIEGVKVYPGPEPGLFQAFKLRPGDVLKSVNGIPLDSPARGLEVLRNLAAARELELDLERDGKRLAYSFTVTQ